jgi:hypothetical protein
VDSLSAEAMSGRLAQIAHNMAVHAVSSLGSLDNVTVLIVLLRGGPASCPLDVSQKVSSASSSSGVGASRTGDENSVPRNGGGGWGTSAASSLSASARDSWEDSSESGAFAERKHSSDHAPTIVAPVFASIRNYFTVISCLRRLEQACRIVESAAE